MEKEKRCQGTKRRDERLQNERKKGLRLTEGDVTGSSVARAEGEMDTEVEK